MKELAIGMLAVLLLAIFFETYIYIEEFGLSNLLTRIWVGRFVACGDEL